MRITSIITALPAPLSVAPVPVCQESKWAPTMTTSSFLSLPGISPMMFSAVHVAVGYGGLQIQADRTAAASSPRRARCGCTARRSCTKVGGAGVRLLLKPPGRFGEEHAFVRAFVFREHARRRLPSRRTRRARATAWS